MTEPKPQMKTAAAHNAPIVGMVDLRPGPLQRFAAPVTVTPSLVEMAAQLDRIEALLSKLIKALKSGAIGAWGNERCHWEGCESRIITWTPPDGKNLCQIHSELLIETPGPHPIR
jgi:hypothetical protein